MKIVVSDTSPLNYLILIDAVDILPALFDQIHVPSGVVAELCSPQAPVPVRQWAMTPPSWLTISTPSSVDPNLRLDRGEIEAICLAEEIHADHLLIDEWDGRREAMARGLHVIGTLGVLDQAALRGLVNLGEVLGRLKLTSYRIDATIIENLLKIDAKRRSERR